MKCKDCGYHWKSENDDFPTCHFERYAPWDLSPCEQEEEDRRRESEEREYLANIEE